jgi:hypothetical protein
MDKSVFGQLVFFVRVEYVQGNKTLCRKSRLGSVYCEHFECEEKLEEFRAMNHWVKPSEIHAEFTFRDHFSD